MFRTPVIVALILFFATATASAAPVPRELKAKPDAERILGLWLYDNYDMGNGVNGNAGRWLFVKDRMYSGGTNTTDQKGTEYGIALRTESTPRQMDISNREGGIICSGIYKFEGDVLHIAYVHGNSDRPKDYASANGKTVIVFKRGAETK